MDVTVDQDKCIGCGICVSVCSQVFEMSGSKAEVSGDCDGVDCCQSAADSCPVDAIEVTE